MIHTCDTCKAKFNGRDGYYMMESGGYVGCSEECVTADGQSMEEFTSEEFGGFWTQDEPQGIEDELLDKWSQITHHIKVLALRGDEASRRGIEILERELEQVEEQLDEFN